jgi:hypothetical protein
MITRYQVHVLGDKGDRCVGMTNIICLYEDYLEIVGSSKSWNPQTPSKPVMRWLMEYLQKNMLECILITFHEVSRKRQKMRKTIIIWISMKTWRIKTISVSGMKWSPVRDNKMFVYPKQRNAFDESCRMDPRVRLDFSSKITWYLCANWKL